MARIGILCPRTNEYKSFDDCIECHETKRCSSCQVPTFLLYWMRDDEPRKNVSQFWTDQKGSPYPSFSVTTLLTCPRAFRIRNTYDYYEKTTSGWNMARGSWAHQMIEVHKKDEKDYLVEQRIEKLLNVNGKEIVISGRPDEVDLREGVLVDYKTKYRVPTKPDQSHEAQFNMYVWLLQLGRISKDVAVNYDILKGGMHYLSWNSETPFKKIPYDIWSTGTVEEFLRERVHLFLQEPPQCAPFTRFPGKWRCDCHLLQEQLKEFGVWEGL